MVLKPKITRESPDKMIAKGGHVQADLSLKNKKEWVSFCLRIQKEMLYEIQEVLENRVGISKTGWILEAIQEKLKKFKEKDVR